jgi:hypothetical protein
MSRKRQLVLPLFLLLLAFAAVACSADEMTPEDDAELVDNAEMDETAMDNSDDMEEMDDMAMGGAPTDLDTSTNKMTDEGLFHVSVSTDVDPLPLNEIHSWTVHVETPDGQAVEGAQISVDGGMPEHNHGFPTAPEITKELGNGDYLLEGVKFSMAGWWELKLNIDDGEQTDQITFNLVLP